MYLIVPNCIFLLHQEKSIWKIQECNPMPKFYPRWLIKHYWLAKKSSNVATSNKLKFDTMTMWVISIHMSLEPLQTLFQTGQINRCTPLSIKLSSVVGQVEHCGSFLKRKSWWPGSNKLHQLLLSNNTIVERKFNFFLWSKNCQSVFTLGHLLVT